MRKLLLALGALPLLCVAACNASLDSFAGQIVPSTGIATSDLEATFTVSGEVDRPTVFASVSFARRQSDELVYLAGDDVAFADGQRITPRSTYESGSVELPRKAPGETYRFEVRRGSEVITAAVVAAAPVQLLAPAADTRVTFGTKLPVSWTAAPDSSMRAQVSGRCLMSVTVLDRESGAVLLDVDRTPSAPAASGASTPGHDPSGATGCAGEGSLVLTRSREERPATAFAKTTAVAHEMTRVPIQLTGE